MEYQVPTLKEHMQLQSALRVFILQGVVCFSRGTVVKRAQLSAKNCVLLKLLIDHAQWHVSWQELATEFGDSVNAGFKKRMDKRINAIREALQQIAATHNIANQYGDGLCLVESGAANLVTEAKLSVVLIVDDNPVNREYMQAILASKDIATQTAADGLRALAKMQAQRFEVVLLDGQMPNLNGCETASEIRKFPDRYGNPKIVGILGDTSELARSEALQSGMDEVIAKPISPQLLLTKIVPMLNLPERKLSTGQSAESLVASARQLMPLINHAYLLELAVHNHDDFVEFMRDLFDVFLVHSGGPLKKLVDADDWDIVSRQAHKLKGMAFNVGFHEFAQALQTWESMPRDRHLKDPNILVAKQELLKQYQLVVGEINAWLAAQSALPASA